MELLSLNPLHRPYTTVFFTPSTNRHTYVCLSETAKSTAYVREDMQTVFIWVRFGKIQHFSRVPVRSICLQIKAMLSLLSDWPVHHHVTYSCVTFIADCYSWSHILEMEFLNPYFQKVSLRSRLKYNDAPVSNWRHHNISLRAIQ